MPGCNYCLTIFLFLVTPILNVIAYISLIASGANTGPIFSYMTFYTVLSVLLALQFFIELLDVFETAKKEHHNISAASLEKKQNSGKGAV